MIKKNIIQNVCELTIKLCEFDSTTGNEGKLVSFIEQFMMNYDFYVERQHVGSNGRDNLLIKCNENAKLKILFSTHLDTVPPFFSPKISNDQKFLLGRGVCDAKGIVAAMICSLFELKKQNNTQIGLLLLVGEETISDGSQKAINGFAPNVKYVINGEPTDLCLAKAMKGSLIFNLQTKGKSGHSAYPESGYSAIHQLNSDLNTLLNYEWHVDDFFGATTLNVGKIEGGEAVNVIAENAKAYCIMRITKNADSLYKEIVELVSLSTKVNIVSKHSAIELYSVENYDSCIVSYSSDIHFLKILGKPILFGPGNIINAHSANEHIRINNLEIAVSIYKELSLQLLFNG